MKMEMSVLKAVIGVSLLVFPWIVSPIACQAEVKFFKANGEYTMSNYDNVTTAEQRAIDYAIRQAAEQAGVYIEGYTKSINMQIAEDEIKAIASDKIQIVNQRLQRKKLVDGDIRIYAEIEANVDTDIIDNALQARQDERDKTLLQYHELQKNKNEQDKKLEELRNKIASLPKDIIDEDLKDEQERMDRIFLSERKYNEGKYQEALKLNPKYDIAWIGLGMSLAKSSSWDELNYDRKAIFINPSYINVAMYGTTIQMAATEDNDKEKATKRAEYLYEQAKNKYPDVGILYLLPAYTRHMNFGIRSYTNQEKESILQGILLSPKEMYPEPLVFPRLMTSLAMENTDEEFAQRVVNIYNDEIKKAPNDIELYSARCHSYAQLAELRKNRDDAYMDYEAAIKDITRVINSNPTINAYWTRAEIHEKIGNLDNALMDYSKMLEIKPRNAYYYELRGRAYTRANDFGKAISDFTYAISLEPNKTDHYEYRAKAYVEKKEYHNAIKDYSKIIELKPNSAKRYSDRGDVYLLADSSEDAIKDYTRAIGLSKENEKGGSTYYWKRALVYGKIGKFKESIQDYTMAIKLDPDNASAYNNRGNSYFELGEYVNALHDFEKAHELAPNDEMYIKNVDITRRKLGR